MISAAAQLTSRVVTRKTSQFGLNSCEISQLLDSANLWFSTFSRGEFP
jgi:hypothetical protein